MITNYINIAYSDRDIPLKKADLSKRTSIVISSIEEPRKSNYTEFRYLATLENDYCDQHLEHIPYHYYLNNNMQACYCKPVIFKNTIELFGGYNDDIFVLLEGGLDSINESNALEMSNFLFTVCTANGISPNNIMFYPECLDPFYAHSNSVNLVISNMREKHENLNISNMIASKAKEREGTASPIDSVSFKPPMTIKNLSEMSGIDEETIAQSNNIDLPTLSPFGAVSAIIKATSALLPKSKTTFKTSALETNKNAALAVSFINQAISPAIIQNLSPENRMKFLRSVGKIIHKDVTAPSVKSAMDYKSKYDEMLKDSAKPYEYDVTMRNALPGYKNAYFEFTHLDTKEITVIGFMVSPTSFSESRSNNSNLTKTKGGWFQSRNGKNPINISFTGYMLDTAECQERHNFIETYFKEYMQDKKANSGDYYNDYSVAFIIEGKKYIGALNNLGIQKSAVQQFLYQYTASFVALDEYMVFEGAQGNKKTLAAYVAPSETPEAKASAAAAKAPSSGKSSETKNSDFVGDNMIKIITPTGNETAAEIFENLYQFKVGQYKV